MGTFTSSLDLGLAYAVTHESFVFSPSTVVYAVPAWMPFIGLSAGAEWAP
jgi:hypothetical protein